MLTSQRQTAKSVFSDLEERKSHQILTIKEGRKKLDVHHKAKAAIEDGMPFGVFLRKHLGVSWLDREDRQTVDTYLNSEFVYGLPGQQRTGDETVDRMRIGDVPAMVIFGFFGWVVPEQEQNMLGNGLLHRLSLRVYQKFGLTVGMSKAEHQAMFTDHALGDVLEAFIDGVDKQLAYEILAKNGVEKPFPSVHFTGGQLFHAELISPDTVKVIAKHLSHLSLIDILNRNTPMSLYEIGKDVTKESVYELQWLFRQYGLTFGMNKKEVMGCIKSN